jgi:hypothetical protein
MRMKLAVPQNRTHDPTSPRPRFRLTCRNWRPARGTYRPPFHCPVLRPDLPEFGDARVRLFEILVSQVGLHHWAIPSRRKKLSTGFHGLQCAEKIEPKVQNCSPFGDSIVMVSIGTTLRVEHVLVS